MAGLVLAMLVYPALSFPRYYNEYPKLPESRELEFKGEGIIIIMLFYDLFSHPHNYKSVFDSIVDAKTIIIIILYSSFLHTFSNS